MSPRTPPLPILGIVHAAVTSSPQPVSTLIVTRRAWDRGASGLTVDDAAEALWALAAAGWVRAVPPNRWSAGTLRLPITPDMEAVHARAVARRRRAREVR